MSLSVIRLLKVLEKERQRLIDAGIAPNLTQIRDALLDTSSPYEPITVPLLQKRKDKFDLNGHNKFLKNVSEDMSILFEEFFRQSSRGLQTISKYDALLRRVIYEGRIINDLMEHELLLIKGSSGYFFGAQDKFRDSSKIDLSNTTATLNLGIEAVHLPNKPGGVTRFPLKNLHTEKNGRVSFDQEQKVISSRVLPGQWFSNCFDSLNRAWQQEFVSEKADGITVSVTIPFDQELSVSAIYVDMLNAGAVEVSVSYSTDGSIFNKPIGTGLGKIEATKLRLAGPVDPARFAQLSFSLPQPTSTEALQGKNVYLYYLVIREIEVLHEAFQDTAVVQSLTLTPNAEDTLTSIDKVSLDVDEEVPPGTEITYQISPSNDSTNFRDISPINRPRTNVSQVIDFNHLIEVPDKTNVQEISSVTAHEFSGGNQVRNGKTFYRIYTFTSSPQFLSTVLRRGLGAWSISKREGGSTTFTQKDILIGLSNENKEYPLHVPVLSAPVNPQVIANGVTPTAISLAHQILSDDVVGSFQSPVSRITIKLSTGARAKTVSFADAVTNLTDSANLRIGTLSEGLQGEKLLDFPHGISIGPLRIERQSLTLSYSDPTGIAVNGVFFIKRILNSNTSLVSIVLDDPEGRLLEQGSSGGLTGMFLSIDVTNDITSIDGNTIYLHQDVPVIQSDSFEIDYLRRLGKDEEVIPSSVVVSSSIGGTVFVVDKDYTLNLRTNSIKRIVDGSIPTNSAGIQTVRVAFSYIVRKPDFFVYETFFDSPVKASTVIDIDQSSLNLPLSEGESIELVSVDGRFDLTTTSSLSLSSGKVFVRVVSKPLRGSGSSIDTTTAIYKTINCTDLNDTYVFGLGRFFGAQEAFASPMNEVSVFDLVYSTHTEDRTSFAVKDDYLILNFNPLSVDTNVLTLFPGNTNISLTERMGIGYSYTPSLESPITGVILKATLSRSDSTDDSITPILKGYNVRMKHSGYTAVRATTVEEPTASSTEITTGTPFVLG